MINGKKILALIPARGGSKGLARKNIINLIDKPLISYPIQAAKKSKYIDEVIVSTNDQEIANIANDWGATIPFLRPEELATDTATSISVLEHAILYLENKGQTFDYIVLLEPTSPLTDSSDIDNALESLERNRENADSVVGVSKVEAAHPDFNVRINHQGLIVPYGKDDFSEPQRRQDINDLYFFEGTLYISDVNILLDKKNFYHSRTLPYIVPKWKAFEIDDIVDLICIEAILGKLDSIKDIK